MCSFMHVRISTVLVLFVPVSRLHDLLFSYTNFVYRKTFAIKLILDIVRET